MILLIVIPLILLMAAGCVTAAAHRDTGTALAVLDLDYWREH